MPRHSSPFFVHSRSPTPTKSGIRVRSDGAGANRVSPPHQNIAPASEEAKDKFTRACRKKGRWINIAICFGIDLQEIFRLGIRSDLGNLAGDDDVINTPNMTLLLTAYKTILRLIPKLKRLLPIQDGANPEYFYKIVNAMQGGCNTARSEALGRIKQNTFAYLAAGQKPVKIDSRARDKSLRGLNSPEIGRLIIPAEYILDWDADPDAAKGAFNTGVLKILGADMPTFLYNDYTYNPDDPEEGLFQGPFLVCVLIDILFGANAVDRENVKRDHEQSRHHCVGEMYKIVTISPQNIAYAAVVARFCLSSKQTWNVKDDLFNYQTFYQAIVMKLADREDPWVHGTLSWWNERVFGNKRGKVIIDYTVEEERSGENRRKFLERQAARKAAALKVAEARRQSMAASAAAPDTSESRPNRVIDPMLRKITDLDSSVLTQTPSTVPLTTNASGPSTRRNSESSPLSEVPGVLTSPNMSQKISNLKRTRHASKEDRPKASKARKRITQA